MHLEVRILKILFQAYYWDCQLQKCWLEFILLENHWQEDKLQSHGEIESTHEFEVYVEMKAEDYPSFSIDNKKVMCYLK